MYLYSGELSRQLCAVPAGRRMTSPASTERCRPCASSDSIWPSSSVELPAKIPGVTESLAGRWVRGIRPYRSTRGYWDENGGCRCGPSSPRNSRNQHQQLEGPTTSFHAPAFPTHAASRIWSSTPRSLAAGGRCDSVAPEGSCLEHHGTMLKSSNGLPSALTWLDTSCLSS